MTNMHATTDFDRLVTSWLTADGPTDIRPEVVDSAIASSLHVRPRRGAAAWLAGVRPWPKGRRLGTLVPSRSVLAVAMIVALLLALTAISIGAQPRRPSLLGEITTTGPMRVAVWVPATEVLADGSVLVVGPVPDMWLHAERWDPVSGTFTVVDGLPATRSVPIRYGTVRLANGDVLLIVGRYENRREAHGGFALRFDAADGRFGPAGTFGSGAVPEGIAEFGFANWPTTVRSDGIVRWTPPPPEFGQPAVTYDPVTDAFAIEAPTSRGGFPVTDSTTVIDLGDGRRYLVLEPQAGGETTATTVDSSGSVESQSSLPANGYYNQGAPLPDGRVLLVGDSIAIVSPDTGEFEALVPPASLTIRGRWLDGRVLLEGVEATQTNDGVEPPRSHDDARAWVFDPASDQFSMLSDTPIPSASTWTVLDDGRVLITSQDNGAYGPRDPIALVLR